MSVSVSVDIAAAVEDVWSVITDFDNCAERLSAIISAEVLERPEVGLIGLKWKETRVMFGKEASETMWITHAEDNRFYQTRAESHGAVYISRLSTEPIETGCKLTMSFEGQPQSLGSKILSALMMPFFKGSLAKTLKQDLEEIKVFTEKPRG